MKWVNELEKLDACEEALKWCRESGHASLESAWAACDRGDFMAWYAGRVSGEPGSPARKRLVLALCEITWLALPHVPDGEERPGIAIETAEAWARDEGPTLGDVVRAADAAYDAADAAYDAARAARAAWARDEDPTLGDVVRAADAAYDAAAYTACAAARAARAADAADAADAAARAAEHIAGDTRAAAANARSESLKLSADIMRKHYPAPPAMS